MQKLSFVLPCYGSQKTIKAVVEEIEAIVNTKPEYDYEIILVNDNSPDDVWLVINELVKEKDKITGINLAKNFGQHAALMAGYSHCTGDIVISLDDDGQSPADEVFSLIEKINEGYDVVYGFYPEIKQSKFRVFGSLVNEKMIESMVGKPKGLKATSYYAAKKFIIDEMCRYKNSYPYVGGLVFRSTKNVTAVPVKHRERLEGNSGYTIRKLLKLWVNGFTAFSEKPLRIATFLGALCACMGFVYGLFVVIRKIVVPSIQTGYSSLMVVLLFVGGIIMLLLGIIGEYVGRIYISINNSPQYVVREVISKDENEN